jgi:hypothetical protein
MGLTLSVTDNQNSTATAAITGSDSGSSNTVYAAPVSQGPAPVSWAGVGSRTGDGTVTISTLNPALYYFYALASSVSGSPAAAPPMIQSVSASALAVQDQVEAAILARIQTLTLAAGPGGQPPAIPASRMVRLSDLTTETLGAPGLTYPCVVVAPAHKLGESQEGSNNTTDNIGFPVWVVILHRTSAREPVVSATIKIWRQQIYSAIRWQTLQGVSSNLIVKPEPGPILDYHPEMA